jgi:hypothetical protein
MHRLIVLASICIVVSPPPALAKSAASATLGFRTAEPAQAELTDPRTGKHYKVALEVDPDVNGRADAVDLVLYRPGSNEDLLMPFGPFHGLQPYDFVGLDLLQGAEKSTFGAIRSLPIRRTATKLVVRVEEVQVRPIPLIVAGDSADAEVTKLQVQVSLRTDP